MELSEYEKLREANLRQNRKILADLGLLGDNRENNSDAGSIDSYSRTPRLGIKPNPKITRGRKSEIPLGNSNGTEETSQRRKSERLSGVKRPSFTLIQDDSFSIEVAEKRLKSATVWNPNKLDPSTYTYHKPMEPRENTFGVIEGVPIGTVFQSRMECNYAGIHRPTVAGIHGSIDGTYSVVLSGGYEDDIDLGEAFTYTGEGGRDLRGTKNAPKNLRTAPQSKDQELSKGNAALVKSIETRVPVRVVRGYRLGNKFAPEEGYRYDGLYTVEKFWMQQGLSGFNVFRFAFKRCPKQGPVPWAKKN